MSEPPPKTIVIPVTSFDDLPDETTVEILVRLPVKDIIRSTSVNKTWYSFINNSSFISQQISRCISHSHSHDNAVLIIPPFISHQNYCSLISPDTSSLIEKFDIPFVTASRSLKLVTQIHGMLLLTDLHTKYSFRELHLWNPYVNSHRVLIATCFPELLGERDGIFPFVGNGTYYLAGMGFDKGTDDYKIVRIVYVKDENGKLFGDLAPKVEIFSMRKNAWRKLENPRVPRLVHEYGIYFNGCYYWLELVQTHTEEASTCCGNKLVIVSFDFHTELFGEFKVPHDVPHILGEVAPYNLMQFEDSLALCVLDVPIFNERNITFPCSIWLMRQENGVVTWTLSFRLVLEDCGCPLDITKNGTLIIEAFRSDDMDLTSIVSYNLKTMVSKDHGFGKHGEPDVSRYVLNPSTVTTSFPQSLIMYKGGESLLKY